MPPDMLTRLPGCDPDVAKKHHGEAGVRARLPIQISTRNISYYRDPAVILIDQLRQIYIDGELDTVDTTNWYPKVMRKDYTVGMNITETAVDDPDPAFYENMPAERYGTKVFAQLRLCWAWTTTQPDLIEPVAQRPAAELRDGLKEDKAAVRGDDQIAFRDVEQ